MTGKRRCTECDEPALVGYGPGPEWLCLRHFEERLARVGSLLRKMQER